MRRVRPAGFEPATLGSEDRCAIQLRHGRVLSTYSSVRSVAGEAPQGLCKKKYSRQLVAEVDGCSGSQQRPPVSICSIYRLLRGADLVSTAQYAVQVDSELQQANG